MKESCVVCGDSLPDLNGIELNDFCLICDRCQMDDDLENDCMREMYGDDWVFLDEDMGKK
jgi:hypothetical protein